MRGSDVVLKVLDGEDTIGGAKILVGWGAEGVFLDFGINYGRWGRYFEEYVKPRPAAGLRDLWALGLIPRVGGLYRRDVVPPGLDGDASALPVKRISGIYVSHAHLDHAGLIGLMDPAIPMISSRMTAAILKGIQDSKNADIFAQSVYSSPFRADTDGHGQAVLGADRSQPFIGRNLLLTDGAGSSGYERFATTFPWLETAGKKGRSKTLAPGSVGMHQATSGGVQVRSDLVDHSVLGACGYTLESPQGPIVYSGDLRSTGLHAASTRAFLDGLAARPPWILLMEGTQVRAGPEPSEPSDPPTELDVRTNCLAAVERHRGKLVVADFGPRNIERLQSFLWIAERTGRQLVVTPKDAYLLYAMHQADGSVPLPTGAIRIYDPPSAQDPGGWERFVHETFAASMVTARELHERQGESILCFSFWDMPNLLELRPSGGAYIYSSSEAHNEEQEIDMERLTNWLDLLGLSPIGYELLEVPGSRHKKMRKVSGFHASGHMAGDEILDWVEKIAPEHLLPVHTEHAEAFAKRFEGTGIRILKGGLA